MSKHTPGPWATVEWPKPNIDGPYLKISVHHRSETCHGGDHCVVEAGHTTPEADATARANARLIAAAPDLLEALQEALKFMTPTSPLADMTRAAIAKATGLK